MSRSDILSRLAKGEKFLLDGATGSELQQRGVNVSKGIQKDGKLGAWSATALGEAPEVVTAVHEDYLRVGCDILTTNSFWTCPTRLGMAGLADKWEEYTRIAGELAISARDKISPDAYVAGGIAPSLMGKSEGETGGVARVLKESGVDLILLEYFGDIDECVEGVTEASETGLPIFLGLKHVTREGTLHDGKPAAELIEALDGLQVDCILAMCCRPEAISAFLPNLREVFNGPIGAYANIGYNRSSEEPNSPAHQWHVMENEDYPPATYAEFAKGWIESGAQVIGGCCATTPAHIEAIRPMVKS